MVQPGSNPVDCNLHSIRLYLYAIRLQSSFCFNPHAQRLYLYTIGLSLFAIRLYQYLVFDCTSKGTTFHWIVIKLSQWLSIDIKPQTHDHMRHITLGYMRDTPVVSSKKQCPMSIDLVTVFEAIIKSRETCENLQCLYENLMSNNFRKMALLKKI